MLVLGLLDTCERSPLVGGPVGSAPSVFGTTFAGRSMACAPSQRSMHLFFSSMFLGLLWGLLYWRILVDLDQQVRTRVMMTERNL